MIGGVIAAAMLLYATGASAYPARITKRAAEGMSHLTESYGFPWDGRLVRSKRIKPSKHVRLVEDYRVRGHHFGTSELVDLVNRVARNISKRFGPGRMALGELSAKHGGKITGHRSHQNGRDADIGFYLLNDRNRVGAWNKFQYLNRAGNTRVGMDGQLARFDRARNWALVEQLVTDEEVAVQHLFVANSIRRIVLRTARRKGVSDEIYERAARMMMPAGEGSQSHTDHFHIRIYCTERDQPRCKDKGPYWDWAPAIARRASNH